MSDVLAEVLEDESIHKSVVEGLKAYAQTGEVTPALKFYLNVVAPRMEKLRPKAGTIDFSEMTPAEEAAAMVELAADFKRDMQRKHGVRTPTPDDSRCWGTVKEEHADVHEPAETVSP